MSELAIYNGTAFALSGLFVVVAPSASVEVRREDTGALASIYSDRAGTIGLSNPTTADAFGRFTFCAAGLPTGYRIRVTEASSPGTEYTLRYQAVGTLSELDNPFTTKGDILTSTGSGTWARKAVGTDGYPLVPVSGASDGLAYVPPGLGFNLVGGYLDWTVVGSPTSTLSVAIKTWAGNDPSATEPVFIPFRSSTVGTGTVTYRKITAATSITINSSALMGTVSAIAFRLWCVAFDDSGTVRLGLINCLSTAAGAGSGRDVTAIYPLRGWGIASSTQESDTSDSAQTFYTDAASVSSMPYATLGSASWETGLPNAGNWNSNPTRIQLWGPTRPLPGDVIQVQRTDTGAVATGTTTIPNDDTIPQNTEGDQYLSQAITPSSAANAVRASTKLHLDNSNAGAIHMLAALFQDSTANALKAIMAVSAATNYDVLLALDHFMLAATSSATTFKVRAGADAAGTTTVNGVGSARRLGGVLNSYIEVLEVAA